jgi:pyruvate dehydrogenase E2 component (dihydrolipoamide acetyltransferase)
MVKEVFIPKMTDHMEAGILVRWLVEEGERVEQGQPILELETDKAVAELESPGSGFLKGIRAGAERGTSIPVGETIAYIAATADEVVPALPPLGQPDSAPAAAPESTSLLPEAGPDAEPIRATPVARRLARELGIDLKSVPGSGPGGRISDHDVRRFAEMRQGSVMPSPAGAMAGLASPPSAGEDFEWLELTRTQRITGQRMLASAQSVPQFSLTVNVAMTGALQFRDALMESVQEHPGARLSVTAILVKVAANALRHTPRANSAYEDGRLKLFKRVNIGVAVGTQEGLIVPVIRDADRMSLAEIAARLQSFREKAAAMRFSPEELTGGTFTISNLGMTGIDQFTAIVNPPETAILAVGRIVRIPVEMSDSAADGPIAFRPMMSLTLSVDHRSMDGLQGAAFLADIKARLERLSPGS